jgi:predicted DCC family thiol-disulfide oxidoreductase YuxK
MRLLEERSAFAGWPLKLVQWLFALVYLSAARLKLKAAGLDWMNGYTLQYYLWQDGLRWDRAMGVWLAQHHTTAWLLSWVTILFEGTFFLVLVFPRLAWIYIPVGIALHTGIYLAMKAYFFQYLASYAVFIPWVPLANALSRRLRLLQSAPQPEIVFDGHCPLCIRSIVVLQYCDWFNRLRFSDLTTRFADLVSRHPGLSREECQRVMHVVLPDGSVQKGFFAYRAILRFLPPLWPLLALFHVPFASAIGPKLYEWIAARRSRIQAVHGQSCPVKP